MLIWIIIGGLTALFYRNYAEMAHEYNRPRGQFGFLGAGIMIGTYIVLGFTLGFLIVLTTSWGSDLAIMMILEFVVVGIAALVTYLIKRAINNSWEKKRSEAGILDQQVNNVPDATKDPLQR